MSLWETITELLASTRIYTIVDQYQGGVRLRCGKVVCGLGPGLHWQWPFIDQILTIYTVPKLVDLVNQSVTTEDGKCIAFSGAVEYSVVDPVKALTSVYDVSSAVQTSVMGYLTRHVASYTSDELRDMDADEFEEKILRQFAPKANEWGLQIDRVYLTDLAQHRVIRLLSNAHYGGAAEAEE